MENLNKNGVSITQTPGEEIYLQYCLGAFKEHLFISVIIATQKVNYFPHWIKRLMNVTNNEANG